MISSLQSFSLGSISIPPLTVDRLMNATIYPSPESFFDEKIKLTDGDYYYPNEEGVVDSVAFTGIVAQKIAFGDLDNEGIDDAAVILGTSGGGTGYFIELVAFSNRNGEPYSITSESLGDRVVVKQITIKNGVIKMKMLTHRDSDGQCCHTKKTTPKYFIKEGKLVELSGVKHKLMETGVGGCNYSATEYE